jgi:hypothetical protein
MRRSAAAGEQENSIDRLFYAVRSGTAEQRKFFSARKAEGLGVGLRNDKIVREGGLAN